MKRLSIIFFILCSSVVHAHFANLQELRSYANAYPELVKSDNTSWADPRYLSFYEKIQPRFWKNVLNFFGLRTMPEWDAQAFKELITRVTESREKQGFKAPFTKEFTWTDGMRVVFFGDICAAYHSLTRDLEELQKLGIIDNEFRIIQDNLYMVFLGNVVNSSPYSMEVLTTLLTLMDRNPERVLLMQGREERNGYWENFTMRRALQKRANTVAAPEDGVIPLSNIINRFFNTLPRVLKIKHEGKTETMYVVHSEIKLEELSDKDAYAVLYGERNFDNSYSDRKGLTYLGFMYGTAQWSLISCPVQVYQEFLKFYYDAFTIFEMGTTLPKSMLTLYSHDARDKNSTFKAQSYDLIYGNDIQGMASLNEPIFTNIPFEFCSTLDLSGVVQALGNATKLGLEIASFKVNFDNGIQNYMIRPNIFDDVYTPWIARKNVDIMIYDYKIPLICCPTGTATLEAYFDKVKSGEVSVLFPITGSNICRKPDLKHIINVRSSYADEVHALIDYTAKEYKTRNFVFFYQDDDYGRDCLEAAHAELKKHGITQWVDVPYARSLIDFTDVAAKIKQASPEAVGCFSTSSSTQELLNKLGTDFVVGRHFFGVSFLESPDLRRYIHDHGIKFTFSLVVPDPDKKDLEIVRSYQEMMDTRGLKYDSNSLEAWICMQLLFDALRHIKPPFERGAIIQYLEGLKNYQLGGLTFTFNPANRSFNLPVWIESEQGAWTKYPA